MENWLIHIDIEKELLSANGKLNLTVKMDISRGELITLFGVSGSGKTTLLRILAGLAQPDKGYISFGNAVWYDSARKINLPPQSRNIGFMFQDYALFPNMTTEENIFFAYPEKDKSWANELMDVFGLSEFRKRKPTGLSGGQKQRVALARALVRRPSLLLLDEPLSALDGNMRASLQEEISKAHNLYHCTTILVSHDLNEIFRLSTRVICLENGKITRTGKPENVFSDTSVSGKFQVTGQIVNITKQDIIYIVTVVTGNNLLKVIALDDDVKHLSEGDHVLVFTKAFNPIITKIKT